MGEEFKDFFLKSFQLGLGSKDFLNFFNLSSRYPKSETDSTQSQFSVYPIDS